MKRTYFVPMCVLAGVLLLCGVAGFVLAGVLQNMLAQTDEIFAGEYRAASHDALYGKALELRRELSFEKTEGGFGMSGTMLLLGALLLLWAFDRRRLIRKCEGERAGDEGIPLIIAVERMTRDNSKNNPGPFRFGACVWGLVTAAGAVAAAASVCGFLGSFAWFLDLWSHFRVQYALGLGIVALLLLIPRRRKTAALFGAFALVNFGVVLPLYLGSTARPAADEHPLRALLSNVNTQGGKPERVAELIRRSDPDIVVLEEVNDRWLSDLGPALSAYPHARFEVREDNFGIALFSRFPLMSSEIVYLGGSRVPSVLAEIETPQGRCTVLATHPLPPVGRTRSRLRNAQLAAIPDAVRHATSPVLLIGDLNTSPWSVHFTRLLRDSGLKDSVQGYGVQPTWPAAHPLLRVPIDHCLHSPEIAVVDRRIGPDVGSDHFPLMVDFVIRTGGRAPASQETEASR